MQLFPKWKLFAGKVAALAISDDKTHKTREKHHRIAALLSEACDFIESAALTANHSAPVVEE